MDGRLALAVVTAVALTGCGAAFGGSAPGGPVDTLTPAPVAETDVRPATPTATPAAERPAWLRNGRVDLGQLQQAHEAFLAGRSYAWELTYNESAESFSDRRFTRRAVVVGDSYLVEQREARPRSVETVFVDGSDGYLRVVEGNETRTESTSDPGDIRDHVPTGQLVKQHLTGVDLSVSVLERDGETYYRLHGTTGQRSAFSGLRSRITNYRVTAYVTPEGFVTTMVVSYNRISTGGRKSVFFRFDYERVGEAALATPDWVGRVAGATPSAESNSSTGATATPTIRPESTVGTRTSAPTGAPATATVANATADTQ